MFTRRSLLGLTQQPGFAFQYPLGLPNRIPGDGCYVRHGYAVENAEYFPGLWHTGENWYLLHGDSADAPVYAAAAGEVVYVGFDYPGLVVIIQHGDELFGQYGHLNREAMVTEGQQVQGGEQIGSVLFRDGPASHLHFELRTFLTSPEVNGSTPRYTFNCGPDCPPGPGYWPMNAPEHPSGMGWRNPLHVINHAMGVPAGAEVMVPTDAWAPLLLWNDLADAVHTHSVLLPGGTKLPLLEVSAGEDASTTVGAQATNLWYRVEVPDHETPVWCPAIAPTMHAIQQDGQTCSYVFNLIPVIP